MAGAAGSSLGPPVPFALVDVFATRPLSGNPLAVVPSADGLDESTMREIAVEFNLSETTFVLEPTVPDAAWWLRSFTPSGDEVVGAGHNALGAWWWLAASGRAAMGGQEHRQQLGDRSFPVRVEGDQTPERVVMRQGAARVDPTVDIQEGLSAALGLAVGHLEPSTGPCVVSTGVEHLMVAVADREVLRQLTPGSAAGPLAALLLDRGEVGPGSTVVIEQGFAMGRPSRLDVTVDHGKVELAGSCVVVADGVLHL